MFACFARYFLFVIFTCDILINLPYLFWYKYDKNLLFRMITRDFFLLPYAKK